MKKWSGGLLIIFLFIILVIGFSVMDSSLWRQSAFSFPTNLSSGILQLKENEVIHPTQHSENNTQAVQSPIFSTEELQHLFSWKNLSKEESQVLQTWKHLKDLIHHRELLPQQSEAVIDAVFAWKDLLVSIEQEKLSRAIDSNSLKNNTKEQCPYSISAMNQTKLQRDGFNLKIPCGLIQDSSITFVGIPTGLLGNFQIDLIGSQLSGETDPPIILHYNVRLQGDKVTENSVIVQNTWTAAGDWGEEERCPLPVTNGRKKVDDLDRCNEKVGKAAIRKHVNRNHSELAKETSVRRMGAKENIYFPFIEGYASVATIWVGMEGFHVTVNGKHVTSFEYRESLEPWLVSGVRFTGDLKLLSVLASGLPTSEYLDYVFDLESLKAVPLVPQKKLSMFIGVFSTANNFNRRMAIRRSWMQYKAVRDGDVAVRFFVGMNKNKRVNEELWKEAHTYGDIQLVPFVDYYSLITLKTIAICTYGTKVVSAQYIMKTDDDTFVRVDEVLLALNETKTTKGLLYGLISFVSEPHRNEESKWYISKKEWAQEVYPPWAHGPGYVISEDIAKFVVEGHRENKLTLFKLEDVAMGIWVEEYKKSGHKVYYVNNNQFFNNGCEPDYVIAHYQGPRSILCLWQKLQQGSGPVCCE